MLRYQTPLSDGATRLPLEVLYRIRDVDGLPIDSGLFQTLIQQSAGWSNEGAALFVFAITRLLADHHDRNFRFLRIRAGL
jgi:hypothetical protein